MKTTSLKTALGGGALVLALIGGGAFLPAPASAGEQHGYLGDGAPATLQQVRIFVLAYGYDDPYEYDGPAYYPPPVAAYGPPVGPPVAYAPPPAYDDVVAERVRPLRRHACTSRRAAAKRAGGRARARARAGARAPAAAAPAIAPSAAASGAPPIPQISPAARRRRRWSLTGVDAHALALDGAARCWGSSSAGTKP